MTSEDSLGLFLYIAFNFVTYNMYKNKRTRDKGVIFSAILILHEKKTKPW